MTKRSAGFVLFSALLVVIAACGGSALNDGLPASGAAGQASAGASNAGAGATSVDVCSAPQVTGPCDAYIPSFWHDPNSGLCQPFIYGGCGGNDNRYPSREACLMACPSSVKAWGACKLDSDCRLVSPGCCVACEPVADQDLLAINDGHLTDQMAPCASVGACAPCPQVTELAATGKYFRAVCVAGQCSALDVGKSPYTECNTSSDCGLRDGVKCCAECDGGFVAVNASANFCPDGVEACGHCVSLPPIDLQVACAQNRCVLTAAP